MTPNMQLDLPVPSTTLGPAWATLLVAALEDVDGHNHTAGSGVKVPVAGLDLNADLNLSELYAMLGVTLARFKSQSAVLSGGLNAKQVYVVNGDLYYQNAAGVNIQITSGGSVAGTP